MEQKSTKTKNQAMITLILPKKETKYPQILETKVSFLSVNYKNFTKILPNRLKKTPLHFIAE